MSVDALDPIEIRAHGSAGPTIVISPTKHRADPTRPAPPVPESRERTGNS